MHSKVAGIFLLTICSGLAFAQIDNNLGITTIPLWAGSAGGGKNSESSTLTVFVPQKGAGNGSAIIIAPGGAYLGLASNLEVVKSLTGLPRVASRLSC